MVEVIYINEYQPSSAKLTLDPIYLKSQNRERFRVGAAPQINIGAILLMIGGLFALFVLAKDKNPENEY